MITRPETPGDHASIRDILIAAFADHPYSHQTEHRIVEGLRADNALTLSLVGDPTFYRRFGFESNSALRMEGVPPEVIVCLPMGGPMPEGNVTHHPAFSVGE